MYLERLIRHCHAQGHDCLLVGPSDGPNPRGTDALCAPVVRIRFGDAHLSGNTTLGKYLRVVGKILLNVWSIGRVIRQNHPDVVFSNTSAVITGGIAARLYGVPHVWHIHENLDTFQLSFILPTSLMTRAIAVLSDRVLFVSRLSMTSVFPQGNVKAVVIHNGVPIPPASEIESRTVHTAASAGKRRIGFFGSSDHRKGVDVLIRAVSLVKQRFPDVVLDVWGRIYNEHSESLRDLTLAHCVSQNVRFQGFCEDASQCMSDYELIAIPSRAESFSLVALEAMAAAVPLVVTRCGGPEEFVVDGVDGWVVPVEDCQALADAIETSFARPQQSLEMAQRARHKVVREFALIEKLEAILEQLRSVSGHLKASQPLEGLRR
ncbi:glycosyltransferase family 4 protein [Cyanobium sp. Copco_Reservoir_LC18]|uniref:glycosyltransferase family 4 protein n=1 Tax=Cyanobium sp. Copco_Reservoir_LC18 TaxID=1328305 RepID=UPI001F22FECE|nr:glycosyltransferase family 4 protein [Cyanobium sp. Copco_Reservoir_LC18]